MDHRTETPKSPGVFPGIPFEIYRGWECFNITTGLQLEKSIGHYFWAPNNNYRDSQSMKIGRMFESLLLEPDKFEENYLITEVSDRRTKEFKLAEQTAATEGKELILQNEAAKIFAMQDSVLGRNCAGQLITEPGDVQTSIVWEENGILCKGRTDKIIIKDKMLIDLKTTADASPETFAKTVGKYGYHVQLAHYASGLRANGIHIEHCIILAVENEPPYGAIPYRLTEQTLSIGEERRRKLFEVLKTAEATEDALAYPDCIQELALATN